MRLDWRGVQVATRVRKAAMDAIDETTEKAAEDAKQNRWWKSRSGLLVDNIDFERASMSPLPRGRFGTTRRGFYGLFLEKRTPFLRPAADREFPRLADRIQKRLR